MEKLFTKALGLISATYETGNNIGGKVIPAMLKKAGMPEETANELGGTAGMVIGFTSVFVGTFLTVVSTGIGVVPAIAALVLTAPVATLGAGIFKGGLKTSDFAGSTFKSVQASIEASSTFDTEASITKTFKNTAAPAAETTPLAVSAPQPALKS